MSHHNSIVKSKVTVLIKEKDKMESNDCFKTYRIDSHFDLKKVFKVGNSN